MRLKPMSNSSAVCLCKDASHIARHDQSRAVVRASTNTWRTPLALCACLWEFSSYHGQYFPIGDSPEVMYRGDVTNYGSGNTMRMWERG